MYINEQKQNIKIKFAIEQAMKAERENRGIALLFLQSRP
jgi:hypothetical protein